jgi:hypothetical protein
MIEVTVTFKELEKMHNPELYIQSKLRNAGIPLTGMFSVSNLVELGKLSKEQHTEQGLIVYKWESK